MNEQEPKYFTDFKKNFNEQEPKYFTDFRNEFTDFKVDINKRLDGHAEQIAHVSLQLTELSFEVKRIDKKIDNNIFQINDIEQRTKKLEKHVFA
ncbi:MAG: hypothetical protein AAB683_00040 [Patescibacteria group bacterium]